MKIFKNLFNKSYSLVQEVTRTKEDNKDLIAHNRYIRGHTNYSITPLYICAPLKDMILDSNEKVENNRIVKSYPDPIVLNRVIGGNLIISKWGDEASDPIVQNEKLN